MDEVIGKNTLIFPLSTLISPGNLPNQLINQGVNLRIKPMIINTIPILISALLNVLCF